MRVPSLEIEYLRRVARLLKVGHAVCGVIQIGPLSESHVLPAASSQTSAFDGRSIPAVCDACINSVPPPRAAAGNAEPGSRLSRGRRNGYSFSTDTSVALIIAKTVSPCLRFIRFTEPVVIIDVTLPAAVRITTSDTTLSETIFSIVPGKRFRMLVLILFCSYGFLPCAALPCGLSACRRTTCDESLISVTIRNRWEGADGSLPASTFSGPIA
jgi:hypothetical protein